MPERYAAERDARPRDHVSMERSREESRDAIGDALYGLVILAVRNGPREISLTAASTLSTLDRTRARRLTDLALIQGATQPPLSLLVTRLEQPGLPPRR